MGEEGRGEREKEFFLFEENREKRVRDNCDINRSEIIFFFRNFEIFSSNAIYDIFLNRSLRDINIEWVEIEL